MKAGRILLVDDEYDIQEIVAEILEDAGFRVIVAKNGREALERLEEDPVDLIVLDIMMPIMSGPEMVRELRKRYDARRIPPILMISAGTEGRAIARELGCNFLVKPFDVDEILEETRRLIGPSGATSGDDGGEVEKDA